jgi:hypothetical protein
VESAALEEEGTFLPAAPLRHELSLLRKLHPRALLKLHAPRRLFALLKLLGQAMCRPSVPMAPLS